MAALINAIQSTLTGASAWTTLVAGGTRLLDDMGRNGLHPDDLSYDSDGLIRLTAVVHWSSGGAAEVAHRTYRRFLYVRLFVDPSATGWANLRLAQRLLRLPAYDGGVIHRAQVAGDNEGRALVSYANDGTDYYDEELNGAAASFVRLYCEWRQR